MRSGLTIDNVLGPVFEGEDQQFWISGVGPASCQMWDVRPDPFGSIPNSHTNRAAAPKGEDGLRASEYAAHPHTTKHVNSRSVNISRERVLVCVRSDQ
jgi:hypothetical protein